MLMYMSVDMFFCFAFLNPICFGQVVLPLFLVGFFSPSWFYLCKAREQLVIVCEPHTTQNKKTLKQSDPLEETLSKRSFMNDLKHSKPLANLLYETSYHKMHLSFVLKWQESRL